MIASKVDIIIFYANDGCDINIDMKASRPYTRSKQKEQQSEAEWKFMWNSKVWLLVEDTMSSIVVYFITLFVFMAETMSLKKNFPVLNTK